MEPIRQFTLLKGVVDTLDDLAKAMPEVAELSPAPRSAVSVKGNELDGFLPSASAAAGLRQLAREERSLRDRITGLSIDFTQLTRPAEGDPLSPFVAMQQAVAIRFAEAVARDKAPIPSMTKASEAAKRSGEYLQAGWPRASVEAAESAAKSLREIDPSSEGKITKLLALEEDAILRDLKVQLSPAAATARQLARQEELAKQAALLVSDIDIICQFMKPDSAQAGLLTESGAAIAECGKTLIESATKRRAGRTAEAEKLRREALQQLRSVAHPADFRKAWGE